MDNKRVIYLAERRMYLQKASIGELRCFVIVIDGKKKV